MIHIYIIHVFIYIYIYRHTYTVVVDILYSMKYFKFSDRDQPCAPLATRCFTQRPETVGFAHEKAFTSRGGI